MSDFLSVSLDDVKSNTTQSSKNNTKDERFFRPNIKNEKKEYQAKVRQLPQGIEGLKNKMPTSVEILTHYIKEPKHKLFLTKKCRKTLGSDESCPLCDNAWSLYNTGKESNNEALMKKGKSRLASSSFIGNFLIRDDINTPENTDKVMLWQHTKNIQKTLFEPTVEQKEDEKKQRGFKKSKERFIPYAPRDGRDFYVIVTENPENSFPSYNASYWDDEGLSPLGATDEESISYLEKCHDLKEFINDVPSVEDLSKALMKFNHDLEARMNGEGTVPQSNTVSNPVSNSMDNPVNSSIPSGQSASEYFNDSPSVDTTSTTFEVAQAPTEEPMLSDVDDELPF